MNRFKITLLITLTLFICLSLNSCSSSNVVNGTLKKTDYNITSAKPVSFGDLPVNSLSPDGKYIICASQNTFAIYDTDSSQQLYKSKIKASIDLTSITWSPDSKYLAFTENFFQMMYEPDIWLVDIKDKKTTDITNDGLDKINFVADNFTTLDTYPEWASDSKNIYFIRYGQNGSNRLADLMKINVSDLKAKKICKFPYTLTEGYPSRLIAADGYIYFDYSPMRESDKNRGIYKLNISSKNTGCIIKSNTENSDPIYQLLTDVKDNKGIIRKLKPRISNKFNACEVLNLENKKSIPITEDGTENGESPVNAVFSPDGSLILAVYSDIESGLKLIIHQTDGKLIKVLYENKENKYFDLNKGSFLGRRLGLNWSDGTIFIATSLNGGILLNIK